jgi:hypothetical protein
MCTADFELLRGFSASTVGPSPELPRLHSQNDRIRLPEDLLFLPRSRAFQVRCKTILAEESKGLQGLSILWLSIDGRHWSFRSRCRTPVQIQVRHYRSFPHSNRCIPSLRAIARRL